MKKVDPRARSSKWRCEAIIRLYKREKARREEAHRVLVAEGIPDGYAMNLLAHLDMSMRDIRDRRNERRRARYAERKAAK